MNIERTILKSTEIDHTTKLFLHTIASYCNESESCFPSQKDIASLMSTSIRTVQRCLRLCLELGLVEVRRRWRRSNIYKVKCLVQKKLSTMATRMAQENKPPSVHKNVSKLTPSIRISKGEWKMTFEDAEEVLGKDTTKRNKGLIITLMRQYGVDSLCECLRWLKNRMLEAAVTLLLT